jgi:alkanal monooxygenase alpha chain
MLTTANPPHRSQSEVFDDAVAYGLTAERCGYNHLWLLEHHFTPYGLCPNTITMAGFMLGITSTIRVGTAVTVAPFMHPIRLAEDVAMLDHLSDGRFDLGLGRGFFPRDFEVFGVNPNASQDILRESVDIIIRAWRHGSVSSDTELFAFPEVTVSPRPRTRPHPPIFVAGQSSSTIEWAAERAIPLIVPSTLDYEETQTRMELYSEYAELAGHDPTAVEHVLACVAYVADSREQAHEAVLSDLKWWSEEGLNVGFQLEQLRHMPNYRFHYRTIEQAALRGEWSADYMVRRWLDANPVGAPDDCIERLDEMIRISGVHHVMLGVEGSGSRAMIIENIERLSTDVLVKVAA